MTYVSPQLSSKVLFVCDWFKRLMWASIVGAPFRPTSHVLTYPCSFDEMMVTERNQDLRETRTKINRGRSFLKSLSLVFLRIWCFKESEHIFIHYGHTNIKSCIKKA